MDEEGCDSTTVDVLQGLPDDACLREDIATDNPQVIRPGAEPLHPQSDDALLACVTIHRLYATKVYEAIARRDVPADAPLHGLGPQAWANVTTRAKAAAHLHRCPAPNPISMDPPHLQTVAGTSEYGTYVVTPKADGTRYQFLLDHTREGKPCALFVDRRMDCYRVLASAPDRAFQGTLLDGELIAVEQQQPCFLIIDLVAAAGNSDYSKLPLDRRLQAARNMIGHMTLRFVGREEPVEIRVKQYFPIDRAYQLLTNPGCGYETDGVIFLSNDLQVAKFTCPVSFKIKREHTIDLLLVAEPCRDASGGFISCEDCEYKHAGDALARQTMIEKRRIEINESAKGMAMQTHRRADAIDSMDSSKRRKVAMKNEEKAARDQKQLDAQKGRMMSFMQKFKTPVKSLASAPARQPCPVAAPVQRTTFITRADSSSASASPSAERASTRVQASAPPEADRVPVPASESVPNPAPVPAPAPASSRRIRWMLKLMYLMGNKLQDAAAGFEIRDDILTFRLVDNPPLRSILNTFDDVWVRIDAKKRAADQQKPYVPLNMKCIVECACTYSSQDMRVNCEIRKVRPDKRDPNSYSVIIGTLLSIDGGVTAETLKSIC